MRIDYVENQWKRNGKDSERSEKKQIINGNNFGKMEIEQWNKIKFQRWKQTGKDMGNMFQWKGK